MTSTEAQHYIRTHNCGCGNALSFKGTGDKCEIICPGNPDHTEHVRIPSPTEQWKAGQQLHPSVQRNIERRYGMTTAQQRPPLDSQALMVIGETAMQERMEVAMKANFGFCLDQNGIAAKPTTDQVRALVMYCATYGLDPLRHEVVLFAGSPLVGLDAYRRKATETGDYLGCTHKPVTDPAIKAALGYTSEDLVDECMVKRLVKGHVAEFSRYGGVRQSEILATSQRGGARHPILAKFPAEMAQNRAEKHALRTAFQFTFADADTGEAPPIAGEYTVLGEGPEKDGKPPSVAGTQPDLVPLPLTQTEQQFSFPDPEPEPEPEPEPPRYNVPEKLTQDQFRLLMGKMQVTSKAVMNQILGLEPNEAFPGTMEQAVDAVFATLLTKGGIPADIRHWAQWLT